MTNKKTKYKSIYATMLVDQMSNGYSLEAVAGIIDTTKAQLETWLEEQPGFRDAYEIGLAKLRLFWDKKLLNPGRNDPGVVKLAYMNLFGWRSSDDKGKDDKEAPPTIIFDPEPVTKESIANEQRNKEEVHDTPAGSV